MNRIALVVGVSCSGKDFLIEKVKPFLPKVLLVVNYGEELFRELKQKYPKLGSRDQIRELEYWEIRESIKAVNYRLVQIQPVVVITHLVLRINGKLMTIPESNSQLAPCLYIHISAPVNEIVNRRRAKNRRRDEISEVVRETAFHQWFSAQVAKQEAQKIGSTFVQIWNTSDKLEENVSTLRQYLSSI
jgi:adenylate kinase